MVGQLLGPSLRRGGGLCRHLPQARGCQSWATPLSESAWFPAGIGPRPPVRSLPAPARSCGALTASKLTALVLLPELPPCCPQPWGSRTCCPSACSARCWVPPMGAGAAAWPVCGTGLSCPPLIPEAAGFGSTSPTCSSLPLGCLYHGGRRPSQGPGLWLTASPDWAVFRPFSPPACRRVHRGWSLRLGSSSLDVC